MKQIVTIFRAEGAQARRLVRSCRRTLKAQLPALRDSWRSVVRGTSKLSGYAEYLDGWSMGDDFDKLLGRHAERRAMPSGDVYSLCIEHGALIHFRRQSRRKHQFPEQATLARIIVEMAVGCGACELPVALAVFREILTGSTTDEDLQRGANQPL